MFGTGAVASTLEEMTTSSELAVQVPFVTVHLNVEEAPGVKPSTAEVGLLGLVIVPVPETNVQTPVPIVGAVAANVAEVTLHAMF